MADQSDGGRKFKTAATNQGTLQQRARPAMASGTRCAVRSKQRALHVLQLEATLSAASTRARLESCARMLESCARRLEACRHLRLAEGIVPWLPGVAVMVKSASEMLEQSLPFGWWRLGKKRKRKM